MTLRTRVGKLPPFASTTSLALENEKKGRLVLTYDLLLIINKMIKAEGKRETMTKTNRMQPGLNFAGPSKTFQTLNAQRHYTAAHVTGVARAFTARGALGRGGGIHSASVVRYRSLSLSLLFIWSGSSMRSRRMKRAPAHPPTSLGRSQSLRSKGP